MFGKDMKYRAFLEPYVKAGATGGEALVYNTLSGVRVKSRDSSCINLIRDMIKPSQNIVILDNKKLETNPGLKDFIHRLASTYMIEMLPVNGSHEGPFVFRPILKVNKDLTLGRREINRYAGENCLDYLHEISCWWGTSSQPPVSMYREAYRQFPFPGFSKSPGGLIDLEIFKSLLKQLKCSKLWRFNLIAGSWGRDKNFINAVNMLLRTDFRKKIVLILEELSRDFNLIGSVSPGQKLDFEVLITPAFNKMCLLKAIDYFVSLNLDYELVFIVESNAHIDNVSSLIEVYKIKKFRLQPHYTGKNDAFFKECVFLKEENIFGNLHSYREIFIKETLNENYFGKLFITHDYKCYANLNDKPLGDLRKHSLKEMIHNELIEGSAWRKVRKHVEPCNQCAFHSFCPPISNYEYVLGKYNLCHILD